MEGVDSNTAERGEGKNPAYRNLAERGDFHTHFLDLPNRPSCEQQAAQRARVRSTPPPVNGQLDICQAFAEVMTSTCKWVIVYTTDMQMLGVPNGPSQNVLNGVLPATPPHIGNVLEQRYVSKPLQYTAFSNGI